MKIRMTDQSGALAEQNTMLQLNNTLLQLTQAVQSLELSRREEASISKLDPFLTQYRGEPNTTEFMSEYSRRASELRNSEVAGIMRQLSDTQAQLAQANLKIQQNQSLLYSYQAFNDPSAISTQNAAAFFNRANVMAQNVDPTLGMLQGTGSFRRYFGEGFTPPGVEDGVSYNLNQALMDRERFQIQLGINVGDPDPGRIRDYYEYQRSQFETAQKAFMNYSVSQKLGISGGIDPTEFERGYTPALTKFSETLGTDMDTAIDALSKLKDLEAVTANIRSGTAASIAMGIDEASKVITRLSQLLNSNDLGQLMDAANRISQFGFGDFNVGLKNIITPTEGTVQSPIERMQSFIRLQNDPAFGQLGYNRSGFETALFRESISEIGARFGDPSDPAFQYLGGAQGIANMATGAVTRMIQSPGFFTAMQGGGNVFQGAMQLSDELVQDPTSFLMNMGQRQFEMRQQYGGQAGFDAIRTQIEQIKQQFNMTDDQALLVLTGGNPQVAKSIKQVWQLRDAEGEQIRQKFARAYENYQIVGGAEILRGSDVRDVGADFDADFYREALERGGRFDTVNPLNIGRKAYTETFGRLGRGIGNIGQALKDYMLGTPEPSRFDLRIAGQGMERITVAEEEFNFARAAADTQRIHTLSVDMDRGRGSISDEEFEEINNTGILLQAILTDSAEEAIDDTIKDVNIGGMVNSTHIKNILSEGLLELRSENYPEDDLRRTQEFVIKASLNDIYNRLKGNLSPDNKFNILIKRAMGIGALDSTIFNEKAISRNIARTTLETMGMSSDEVETYTDSLSGVRSFKQEADKFFSTGIGKATSFAAGAASFKGGVALGAAIGTAILPGGGTVLGAIGGGIVSPFITEEVVSNIGGIVESVAEAGVALQEQFGDKASFGDFMDYIASGEEGTLVEKEIKNIIKFIYSLWEHAEKGISSGLRRLGLGGASTDDPTKDVETLLFQTIIYAQKILQSGVKEGESPGAGLIDEVASKLLGLYTRIIVPNEDITKDNIMNLIKLVLNLLTAPGSETRIILKKRAGVRLLQRQVADIISNEKYLGSGDWRTTGMDNVQNVLKVVTSGDDSSISAFAQGIRKTREVSIDKSYHEISDLQAQFLRNLEKGNIRGELTQRLIGGEGIPQEEAILSRLLDAAKSPDKLSDLEISGTELEKGIKAGFGDTLGQQALNILQSPKRTGETEEAFNERRARELFRVFDQFSEVGKAEKKEIVTEAFHTAELFKSVLSYLAEDSQREVVKTQLRNLGLVND